MCDLDGLEWSRRKVRKCRLDIYGRRVIDAWKREPGISGQSVGGQRWGRGRTDALSIEHILFEWNVAVHERLSTKNMWPWLSLQSVCKGWNWM